MVSKNAFYTILNNPFFISDSVESVVSVEF